MNCITLVNSQFNPDHSSCSTKKPKGLFYYDIKKNPDTIATVYCDHAIKSVSDINGTNYAWILESPGILGEDFIKYVKANSRYLSFCFKKVFTCIQELVGIQPNFVYCPSGSNLPWINEQDYKIYDKTKVCSMFCSPKGWTEGHRTRLKIAEYYKDKLDLYGGVFGSSRLGEGIHPNKLPGLAPYMFSLVVENCVYDKYYTEKITDCFATGTIPVYLGTRKITEDFNGDGIIFLDEKFSISDLTLERYMSKIDAIRDNFERVKNLEMADDVLYKMIV